MFHSSIWVAWCYIWWAKPTTASVATRLSYTYVVLKRRTHANMYFQP